MTVADLPMLVGAMLGAVGTVLVVEQFVAALASNHFPTRSAHISHKEVSLRTTYPVLVMIAFGAVLLLASKIVG
jgi:hypothetical protein